MVSFIFLQNAFLEGFILRLRSITTGNPHMMSAAVVLLDRAVSFSIHMLAHVWKSYNRGSKRAEKAPWVSSLVQMVRLQGISTISRRHAWPT